jgi:hypothetical protein
MIVLGIILCLVGMALIDTNIEVFKTNWMGALGYIVVVCGAAVFSIAIS